MQRATLLTAATGATSAPSSASDGVAITALTYTPPGIQRANAAVLHVWSTAGSGTMDATFRLWGYIAAVSKWFPLGTGTGATKGVINVGAAIDETGTDALRHAEVVDGLRAFSRVALQVTAIGGTSTAVSAALEATA